LADVRTKPGAVASLLDQNCGLVRIIPDADVDGTRRKEG
jgi:hypothetical protein